MRRLPGIIAGEGFTLGAARSFVAQQLARHQQHPLVLAYQCLDVNWLVPPDEHHLRYLARIVAVALVRFADP